jgi:hypothetical protein
LRWGRIGRGAQSPLCCAHDPGYENEENECDDEKIEHGPKKVTVAQYDICGPWLTVPVSQHDSVLAPVAGGKQQRDTRHDDVGYEGGYDLAERTANHDTDREIDHVPFERELLEVLPKLHRCTIDLILAIP